jgi:hypothetical protein
MPIPGRLVSDAGHSLILEQDDFSSTHHHQGNPVSRAFVPPHAPVFSGFHAGFSPGSTEQKFGGRPFQQTGPAVPPKPHPRRPVVFGRGRKSAAPESLLLVANRVSLAEPMWLMKICVVGETYVVDEDLRCCRVVAV